MPHVVIVGAGQAGGRTARALREQGFDDEITLIGDEGMPPYDRPPLSKAVLKGEATIENIMLADEKVYRDNSITFMDSVGVLAIDPDEATVLLKDGKTINYDHLVLTTGGRARSLPISGADLENVHLLRTAGDSMAVSAHLKPGANIAVIGGGFIGLEVAASARQRGCNATVLEQLSRILARSMPEEAARDIAWAHRQNGVEIRTDVKITKFLGEKIVEAIAFADGSRMDVDAVVIGIGIVPETKLAATAGLDVGDGIVTDEFGRTSRENIYAAGDCASAYIPRYGRHVRLETYQNANLQSVNVARTIMGKARPYDPVPWLWSDQFDWSLQSAGFPSDYDTIAKRGDVESGAVTYFSLKAGVLTGVTGFGKGTSIVRDVRFSQMLMEKEISPTVAQLSDPEFPLKSLLKPG